MVSSAAGESDDPHRLTFQTAAAQCTAHVPVAEPTAVVRHVREALADRLYDSASHIVVCRGERFLGVVTIEDLFGAPGESPIDSIRPGIWQWTAGDRGPGSPVDLDLPERDRHDVVRPR
jgi:hypothetical protein